MWHPVTLLVRFGTHGQLDRGGFNGRLVCGLSNPIAEVRGTSCGDTAMRPSSRLPLRAEVAQFTGSVPATALTIRSAGLCVSRRDTIRA